MFYYSPLGLLVVMELMFWTWTPLRPCAWCARAPSRAGGAVAARVVGRLPRRNGASNCNY